MFVAAEVRYNLWLAGELRRAGFEVYCPNESEPINDKTRTDITPRLIYDVDIQALEASNVVLLHVSEDPDESRTAAPLSEIIRRPGVIPALPLIVFRPFLPESPAWIAKKKAGTLKRPSFAELFAPQYRTTTIVTTIQPRAKARPSPDRSGGRGDLRLSGRGHSSL